MYYNTSFAGILTKVKMQDLYNLLMQPSTNADGTIRPPSNLNRRAAQAIQQLHNMQQNDKTERMKLQQEREKLVDHVQSLINQTEDYFWNYCEINPRSITSDSVRP